MTTINKQPDQLDAAPDTIDAAAAAAAAAMRAGAAIKLPTAAEARAAAKAQAAQASEDAAEKLVEGTAEWLADDAAFATLAKQAGETGAIFAHLSAADVGRKWLREQAAAMAKPARILAGKGKGNKGEATGELRRLCGLYQLARKSAKLTIERMAREGKLPLDSAKLVKSTLQRIKRTADAVLAKAGLTVDYATLAVGVAECKAEKTPEQKARKAIETAVKTSLDGVIAGLGDLPAHTIALVVRELQRGELRRRCKVAGDQAQYFADQLKNARELAAAPDATAQTKAALVEIEKQTATAAAHAARMVDKLETFDEVADAA